MKLSLSYKDPLQLSETLAELGQNTRITQLDLGEGAYSMSHAMSSGVSIAEIKASKTLLYEGWGTDWSVDFNWITPIKATTDPFGYCEGYEMHSNSIGGLNTINSAPGSSWGKYSEACSSTACMLDKAVLIDSLKACNAQTALENLTTKRGLDVHHFAALQLRKLAQSDMSKGIVNASKYYDLITCCLEEGTVRHYKKSELKNLGLLSEIVSLSHSKDVMQSPMSLSDVCKYLDTGQASLYRICQEYFGIGIIEMMMQVRLEESRRALLRQKDHSQLHESTIREIAIRYGFKHAGRYARRYFTSFGELPSQTIQGI
jgi:AraC-like DNA-binding protein